MVSVVLPAGLLDRVLTLAREVPKSALRIFLLLGGNLAVLLDRFLDFFTRLGRCSCFRSVAGRNRTAVMVLAHDF
jgi:hypothetical protein